LVKIVDELTHEIIEGVLERIVYEGEEDGYIVARLSSEPLGNEITVVGCFTAIPGTQVRLQGNWIKNPRYGLQFQVEAAQIQPPATLNGIVQYLSSSHIPGIGPVMAQRLVEHFGRNTLDVMEKDPERLVEVEGIGRVRIESIQRAWKDQRDVREVMVFLQGHGVSPLFAHKIYSVYGNQTIQKLMEDPYRLARDVFGIGFKKADGIAKRMGLSPTSMARCRAGLMFTLQSQAEEGHVYVPKNELMREAQNILEVEQGILEEALQQSTQWKDVVVEEVAGEPRVYLRSLYDAETETSRALKQIYHAPGRTFRGALSDPEWHVDAMGVSLNRDQRRILDKAITKKLLVVTGGPGTGKTTAMRALLERLDTLGAKVELAAPTGRAAKRLSEATGREARTIHRLLEFQPKQRRFLRNRNRPLQADFVLIDEASMVDLLLMYHLTQAISPSAALTLVGDVDQLPSVGPGNVLKDIIASGMAEVVVLREIFRQSEQSGIVINAHRIQQGESPKWRKNERDELSDFYFISQSDPVQIQKTVITLCADRIPGRFDLDPKRDIQVLTPMHRGILGTEELNQRLQDRLNPSRRALVRGLKQFSEGDKVMQIRNNYDKEVFNGDIGIVSRVDRSEGRLWVQYDERDILYDWRELDEIVLAYAISVHKSQGSEYQAVVLPLVTQHYLMLQRNLLYTGITRAKKLVVLIGTHKALAIAVKNDQIRHRYTGLRRRLQDALAGGAGQP
jgi:exodeoxyribonuclease V alpha subunit